MHHLQLWLFILLLIPNSLYSSAVYFLFLVPLWMCNIWVFKGAIVNRRDGEGCCNECVITCPCLWHVWKSNVHSLFLILSLFVCVYSLTICNCRNIYTLHKQTFLTYSVQITYGEPRAIIRTGFVRLRHYSERACKLCAIKSHVPGNCSFRALHQTFVCGCSTSCGDIAIAASGNRRQLSWRWINTWTRRTVT